MKSINNQNDFLNHFNNTFVEYEKTTLHKIFEEQVIKSPNEVAVIANKEITYSELNKRANQLARYLVKVGIAKEDVVALMLERSLDMIIAILAVLKAGGAYLPIDINYPNDRIKYIIENSKAKVVISVSNKMINKEMGIDYIDLDANNYINEDTCNIGDISNTRNLAYVIYTSGSTGAPKGAMIEHYSIVNRLNWMVKEYQFCSKDIILQKTPYTFDVSVWELFLWFFVGAKVCFLKQGDEKNVESIIKIIERNHITTIHFVPPMLNVFLDYIEQKNCIHRVSSLKRVISSGEALNVAQVNRFNKLLYLNNGTQLHNLYGPTEATVDVTFFDCTNKIDLDVVPIGKPIDNNRIYIFDENNIICPIGTAGEIYIAGDGVGRGYINNPELTAKKFLEDPYVKGSRMYRTGDLAKWNNDGNIEYLGRLDYQVKIRGNRVELGEIETHLLKHDYIKQAVVTAMDGKDGSKFLCAYYSSDYHLNNSDLRAELQKRLPEYMIPSYFIKLDEFPTNTNGKIDRKKLPIPDKIFLGETTIKQNNSTNIIEVRLKEIIQENLDVFIPLENLEENVLLTNLGINSISFTKIVIAIEIGFGIEFDNDDLDFYEYPNIGSLILYVKDKISKI
jgi:amino acid adenylation domain-containing protein